MPLLTDAIAILQVLLGATGNVGMTKRRGFEFRCRQTKRMFAYDV